MAVAPSSISKGLADIVECTVCTEVYTDPTSLPCVHTFCFKCLEHLCQDNLPEDDVSCPMCKKEFTIPDSGMSGLPKNFFFEKMKLPKEYSMVNQHSQSYCEQCGTEEFDIKKDTSKILRCRLS